MACRSCGDAPTASTPTLGVSSLPFGGGGIAASVIAPSESVEIVTSTDASKRKVCIPCLIFWVVVGLAILSRAKRKG